MKKPGWIVLIVGTVIIPHAGRGAPARCARHDNQRKNFIA